MDSLKSIALAYILKKQLIYSQTLSIHVEFTFNWGKAYE